MHISRRLAIVVAVAGGAAWAAHQAIEAMLGLMAERDPAILGGGLPDEGFYAL